DAAQALIEELVELLIEDFGYTRKGRKRAKGALAGAPAGGIRGATGWADLFSNISTGQALHDSLRDLAAKLIKSGTDAGAAVNQLRGMLEASTAPRHDRFRDRWHKTPRLAESGVEKCAEPQEPAAPPTPCTIEETLAVFDRWLLL